MKKLVALLIPIAFMAVMQANAQSTPRVDQRQHHQHARIRYGVASGELTRREAAHAVHDQRHIRRAERRIKADGHPDSYRDRRERARLHHQQNQASRELRRNKHDAQTRAAL